MTTEQGNKLIAEYMDIPKCDRCPDCGKYRFGTAGPFYSPAEMQYREKWDWLMPVAEHIARYEFPDGQDHAYFRTFGMLDASNRFMVRINRMQVFHADTLIEATWLAVVDFIQSLPQ